jgi:hypothetical protein
MLYPKGHGKPLEFNGLESDHTCILVPKFVWRGKEVEVRNLGGDQLRDFVTVQ